MTLRRPLLLATTLLFLVATACGEGTPLQAPVEQARGTQLLRWPAAAGLQFEATGPIAQPVDAPQGATLKFVDGAAVYGSPSVDKFSVSFWAVSGKSRTVQINYVSGDKVAPYMRFTAVDPEWAPGVGELQSGDSVLITMSVSPLVVGAMFQPAGLQFDDPSPLQIWYGGVGGDLNGDGIVGGADATIEGKLLGMSYRENASYPWSLIPFSKNTTEKWVRANLYHFSEYAVSW